MKDLLLIIKDLLLIMIALFLIVFGALGGVSQIMPDDVIDNRLPFEYDEMIKKNLEINK